MNQPLMSWLDQLPLEVDSLVFTFKDDESGFKIKEVYRPYREHKIISNLIGHWSRNYGLIMTGLPLWERRKNLMGFQFRVAVIKV